MICVGEKVHFNLLGRPFDKVRKIKLKNCMVEFDPTFYSILDVPRNATAKQLKKAHRKALLKYHSDRNQHRVKQADEETKKVNLAWETLGDPEKRKAYDIEL